MLEEIIKKLYKTLAGVEMHIDKLYEDSDYLVRVLNSSKYSKWQYDCHDELKHSLAQYMKFVDFLKQAIEQQENKDKVN